MRRATVLTCLMAAVATQACMQKPDSSASDDAADPFLFLEEQTGARAMAWVDSQNVATTAVLESDPAYASLHEEALAIAQSHDRIAYASFHGGDLYNFWQDSSHVRGVWRRTTLSSYRTSSPKWTTVLDLDSLTSAENANWVWEGADCAAPAERRCLIGLSDGGEDAVTYREFDVQTRSFVQGGFELPRGKQQATWQGEDTILVAREWQDGDLTPSGYAFIVRRLVRGQPLDSAEEIFRGDAEDGGYGVRPSTLTDGTGHRAVLISRPLTTFEAEVSLVTPSGVEKLALPLKSAVVGMVDGQILVQLSEPWQPGDTQIATGALVSVDLAGATAHPDRLDPVVVFAPGPRESVNGVTTTRDRVLASIYQNVRGGVFTFARGAGGGWTQQRLPLPDNLSTTVMSGNDRGSEAFVSVAGFLTPSSVWLADARNAQATRLKSLPAQFDASQDTVEQLEATSKDGTKIPYFVVHSRGMEMNGSNPTILTAYGGFEVSETPSYSGTVGKLWLERGGVFVLANIRGGGEFGPAWHEAGLKTHRQVIYDDFAAVARDLIDRGVTSTPRLGIMGGSNGGLLMGVEMTQNPDLFHAVDIQVPLLDMLRYEQIDAGASWVGEYGSVSNPDERAFLASISPYQNLKRDVTYPEPLIWTTTKDDRVGPQHARKFAAKMALYGHPYFFYEVTEGGHGAGANLVQSAHTNALEYTYFTRKLMGR